MPNNTLLPVLLSLLCCACETSDKKPAAIPATVDTMDLTALDSLLADNTFNYENPMVLDSFQQIVFPMSVGSTDTRSKASLYKKGNSYPHYWNVFFYNTTTGNSRLLTKQKSNIWQIDIQKTKGKSIDKQVLTGKILYTITTEDYNNDGKLTFRDPKNLFLSNIDGSLLQRISPAMEHLTYYRVLQPNQILLQTKRETNGDGLYDTKDESIWYLASEADKKWTLSEVIHLTNREEHKKLFLHHWMSKE